MSDLIQQIRALVDMTPGDYRTLAHSSVARLSLQARLTEAADELSRLQSLSDQNRLTGGWRGVPEGWKLVPLEPTPAMIAATAKQVDDATQADYDLATLAVPLLPTIQATEPGALEVPDILAEIVRDYRSMLAASPPLTDTGRWRAMDAEAKAAEAIIAGSIHHDSVEVVRWRDGPDDPWASDAAGWTDTGPNADRFYVNENYFTHYQPVVPPLTLPGGEEKR